MRQSCLPSTLHPTFMGCEYTCPTVPIRFGSFGYPLALADVSPGTRLAPDQYRQRELPPGRLNCFEISHAKPCHRHSVRADGARFTGSGRQPDTTGFIGHLRFRMDEHFKHSLEPLAATWLQDPGINKPTPVGKKVEVPLICSMSWMNSMKGRKSCSFRRARPWKADNTLLKALARAFR